MAFPHCEAPTDISFLFFQTRRPEAAEVISGFVEKWTIEKMNNERTSPDSESDRAMD